MKHAQSTMTSCVFPECNQQHPETLISYIVQTHHGPQLSTNRRWENEIIRLIIFENYETPKRLNQQHTGTRTVATCRLMLVTAHCCNIVRVFYFILIDSGMSSILLQFYFLILFLQIII